MSKRPKTLPRIGRPARKGRLGVVSSNLSQREREMCRDAADLCASTFAIVNENLRLASAEGTPKSKLRHIYLREIYRAVVTLLKDQTPSQLEETFRMALDSRSPYTDQRSLFSLAIQFHEMGRSEKTSKATRSIRAKALEYAWRHKKTPEEVPQFLVNLGGVKKAADFGRDPEKLHYWAISH